MLEHLNIEPISQDSFDDGNSSTFKTSSEVIQKVMNGETITDDDLK